MRSDIEMQPRVGPVSTPPTTIISNLNFRLTVYQEGHHRVVRLLKTTWRGVFLEGTEQVQIPASIVAPADSPYKNAISSLKGYFDQRLKPDNGFFCDARQRFSKLNLAASLLGTLLTPPKDMPSTLRTLYDDAHRLQTTVINGTKFAGGKLGAILLSLAKHFNESLRQSYEKSLAAEKNKPDFDSFIL